RSDGDGQIARGDAAQTSQGRPRRSEPRCGADARESVDRRRQGRQRGQGRRTLAFDRGDEDGDQRLLPARREGGGGAGEAGKRGRLYAPAVVLTGHQIAGRGRGTNTWWSDRGCLTVTFVFPIDDQLQPHQIPLLAGLAIRNAAAELTGDQRFKLKWPNDVLHE